jgi:hypothetical protein
MVPVASALGRHDDAAHALAFRDTAIIADTGHIDLLGAGAYPQLRAWLEAVP